MEWLFRRHFWIVHLAFVALAAIILAAAFNVIFESWLSSKLVVPEKKVLPRPAPQITQRDFSIANERNLFEAKREVPRPPPPPGGDCDTWETSVQSGLRGRLVGTAVFQDPRHSTALIEDGSVPGGSVQTYSINGCLGSLNLDPSLLDILGPDAGNQRLACNELMGVAEIKRIDIDRIFFYNKSERRCEFMAMAGADLTPIPVATKPSTPTEGEFGKSVRKISPNLFEIDRNDLDSAMNNLSVLLTQVRGVPAFEDGKPVGFKLFSILPNSLFSKIGFENGDVITKINGYELSPEKALELLQKLRDESQVNVQGKKSGGGSFNYEYNIKR